MDDLSDWLIKLRLTWQQFGGSELNLVDKLGSLPENSLLSVAIAYEGTTLGWLQAIPPADKVELAQSVLQSWADLLGTVAGKFQVLEGLADKLVVAWNRMSFLHQVTELMRTTTDPWLLALEALRFAIEAMEAENAFIAQLVDNNLVFRCINPTYDEPEMRHVVAVLHNVEKMLIRNGAACRNTFPELAGAHSFIGQQLNVKVDTPLFIGLINQTSRHSFDAGDVQLFGSLVEQLTAVIEIDALHRQQIQTEQLNRDLEIAAEVQNSFLPSELPQVPGYEFAAALISASKIGGDFYDICIDGDKTGMLVCDIAGKGISAALLGAEIRTKIKAELELNDNPGRVLQQANARLYKDMSHLDRFATAALFYLSSDTPGVRYANAGHTTAFWIQAEPLRVQHLPSNTLPLGIFPDIEDIDVPVDIQPNDVLVIYSDGLTEVENEHGQILGLGGVTKVLLATHTAPAQFILDSLLEANEGHRGSAPVVDDLTLLVIKKVPDNVPVANYLARLHFPGDLGILAEVESELARLKPYLPPTNLTDTWLMQLQLSMTEAVSNIIRHAYTGRSGDIHGLIALYLNRLQIDLFDTGLAYEPKEVLPQDFDLTTPPEGGYGLHIIHEAMDVVNYQRLPGGYNHWRFGRYLPG